MDWKQVKYDAIVVGSGATGCTAARWLTKGGANVLLLEAGPELPMASCGPTEKSAEEFNALKIRQPIQSRSLLYDRKNCHLFVDDLDNPYATHSGTTFNWIRSRQAGGRTLVWSRFALRMSEEDLSAAREELPETGWPVPYRDLAPYYDQIETLARIYGTVERIPSLPDGRFLPRRMSPYLGVLRERLTDRFPNRHLLPSREVVDHQGGRVGAPPSSSSLGSMLLHAARERLTFRTNCVVAKIELDGPDHADRVVFVDRSNQRWYEVTGRVIVLCASTIESTRILLASVSRHFPTGLGNSSGALGHYLMDHFGGPRIVALGKIAGVEPASRESAYIPRFCNIGGRTEEFSRGYGIQAHFEAQSHGQLILTMGVFGEVLPYFDNGIELEPSITDACGVAVPKISFRYRDNEHRMAIHAQRTLRDVTDALGFRPMIAHDELLAPGTRAHELGGARMGSSPENSVLNRFNQCWDVKNLFVTDGACFPTAGDKGPTLTMMALTARACDHILRLLRSGAL
jgi:choline dehydrogenase-like flavoprotein